MRFGDTNSAFFRTMLNLRNSRAGVLDTFCFGFIGCGSLLKLGRNPAQSNGRCLSFADGEAMRGWAVAGAESAARLHCRTCQAVLVGETGAASHLRQNRDR